MLRKSVLNLLLESDYISEHVAPPHEKKGLCLKDRNLSKFSTKMCLQYSITTKCIDECHHLLLIYYSQHLLSRYSVTGSGDLEFHLAVLEILYRPHEILNIIMILPMFPYLKKIKCYLLILSSFGVAEVDVLQLSSSTVIRCRMCLREFFEVDIIELGDVKVLSLTLVDHV
ncbi:hypothetical protein AGLY_016948 [Aphis glycines]|uniref:Uncharacterized protein n=1 Tax=Aphis glycines TaxID=307491 RepID=A0A6G0SX54_APHGL|nr:hypothetical protein AGLY_016948 [Aphis glycines]